MDTNVVGALTYLAGFLTGIIFLVLDPYKSNSFVRFHAFQSIFFNVAWVAFWIVWMIVSAVLTPLTAGVFGLIALPLMLIFTLAGFGIWIFLMYQAYQQKLFKLPIVGKFAARAGGRKAVMCGDISQERSEGYDLLFQTGGSVCPVCTHCLRAAFRQDSQLLHCC